jgi:NAD(P)-dependent dehydrogenase (short-subunit alcohol dehydrogenase family)
VHAGGDQDHEVADAEGRAHRQQRLDLGHTPRPNSVPYTATKHAITGLTKCTALDGRKHDIACGQLDIGNADTAMGGPHEGGVMQAYGESCAGAGDGRGALRHAIRYMASLPLDTNVLFMQIKATKMPFEGRG